MQGTRHPLCCPLGSSKPVLLAALCVTPPVGSLCPLVGPWRSVFGAFALSFASQALYLGPWALGKGHLGEGEDFYLPGVLDLADTMIM